MSYTMELDPELDEFEIAGEAADEGEFGSDELSDEFEADQEFARRGMLGRRGGIPPRPSRPRRNPYPRSGGYARIGGSACVCPQHGTEFVRWVQSSLNQLQGVQIPVNGVMGASTRNALRRFQREQQLPVDGIAGPETEKALTSAKRGGAMPLPSPTAGEFEFSDPELDEVDELDELAQGDEFEASEDRMRWPRERSFRPQLGGTIPSGPYRTGSGLCDAMESDMQDLLLSIEPFSRSVAELYRLTKEKPRNQALIDETGQRARRQMSNLKINLVKMRDRVKGGFYLRNGCTRQDIAKVTERVRARKGAWRRIATIERLRDELVYWLRNSR